MRGLTPLLERDRIVLSRRRGRWHAGRSRVRSIGPLGLAPPGVQSGPATPAGERRTQRSAVPSGELASGPGSGNRMGTRTMRSTLIVGSVSLLALAGCGAAKTVTATSTATETQTQTQTVVHYRAKAPAPPPKTITNVVTRTVTQTVAHTATRTVTAASAAASAPTPTGCHPLTNSGNCYEPGEYCRDDDHGTSGIAGDGQAITCENNDGWRWEPT